MIVKINKKMGFIVALSSKKSNISLRIKKWTESKLKKVYALSISLHSYPKEIQRIPLLRNFTVFIQNISLGFRL